MGSIATIKEEDPTDGEDDSKNHASQIGTVNSNELIEDLGYGTDLGNYQMYEDMAALEIQ